MNLLDKNSLGQLLQRNWTLFLDKTILIRKVEEHARNAEVRIVRAKEVPRPQTKLTITKFEPFDKLVFEIWVEFSVPKGNAVIVGSHIYHLGLDGELELIETLGTAMTPEN